MLGRKSFILFFCLVLLAGMSNTYAAGSSIKIGTDNLNVRKGPGLSYPIVGQAKKGEHYSLLSQEGDWIQIEFEKGTKGWVANWLVSVESESQNTSSISSGNSKAIIGANGLRIRKGPGTEFQVIGTVHKGESYEILTSNGIWSKLKTPFGDGWVSNEFIQQQQNTAVESKQSINTGKITASSLNVRSMPSLQGAIVGKLQSGDKVEILSQENGWTEIDFSGKPSWVSSQYVQVPNKQSDSSKKENETSNPVNSGQEGTVTATSLTVRSSGSLNGKAIGSVSKGQTFKIIEEVNNWAKIEYKTGSEGWVAGWYLEKPTAKSTPSSQKEIHDSSVTILHNGSNIRENASTQSSVILRANEGDTFEIISLQNDWYEIKLSNGGSGFVAGWIVSVNGPAPKVEKLGAGEHLRNKTIVLDPGHGGRDNGTTGARGTLEKNLTLRTAQLLSNKLKASGANVILTRNNDTYIPLKSRVSLSHYYSADAFISIHYDSIADRSVRGMTTYYYHSYQKNLAENIHTSTVSSGNLKDRSYRFGDYHVVRENKQSAVLLELGYLSNPAEEMLVSSGQYQETIAMGIFQGLARYFKN